MKESKETKQEEQTFEVRMVSRTSETVLLQWVEDGKLKRGLFPSRYQYSQRLASSTLARGLPVDDNLSKFIHLASVTAAAVEANLKQHGIFTIDDAMTDPTGVSKSFYTVMNEVINTFMQQISETKKERK